MVIRSMGVVSSVGLDAKTTCASIRAGITRAGPISGFKVLDIDSHENVCLRGHAVPMNTEGFAAPARWLRLARMAFRDMRDSADVPGIDDVGFWSSSLIVCVTPDINSGRFLYHPILESETVEDTYLRPLVRSLGLPERRVYLLSEGRVGALRAMAEARDLMNKHGAERVLVLAADSYLDGFSLEWLATLGRLKTDANPVGLSPGECGVSLLLEPREVADNARKRATVSVSACALGEDSRLADAPTTGRALARVMTESLAQAKLGEPFCGDLFIDLNGEPWRAHEFGCAQVLVPGRLLGDVRQQICATSVGDTGAASGGLNVAVATRALERGYARASTGLVVSSSYDGGVGAVVLNREA